MVWKSPQEAATKYQNRVSQSAQAYATGVQRPGIDWVGSYQAAIPRMNAGLQQAIAEGRMGAGAQRAGNSKWQNNARTKGATNYASAAPQAGPAYQQAMQQQYGLMQQAFSQIQGMPSDTRAARLARMTAYLTEYGNLNDQRKSQP